MLPFESNVPNNSYYLIKIVNTVSFLKILTI